MGDGTMLICTHLYTFVSVIPIVFFSFLILKKEGWFDPKKNSKGTLMLILLLIGVIYQSVLPYYWSLVTAYHGLPMDQCLLPF